MAHRAVATSIVLLLTVATIAVGFREAHASTPTVNRLFYLTKSRELGDTLPPPGTPDPVNVTRNRVEFGIPTVLLSGITVSGQINFSLWISSSDDTTLSLNGTFIERLLNGFNYTVPIQRIEAISAGVKLYNFAGTISPRTLTLYSRIFVAVTSNPEPRANVTLLYGSSDYASMVVLPLSGYMTFSADDPVRILDSFGNRKANFDLNSTNKAILFQADVFPAFGGLDLQRPTVRINLTVMDSNLRAVTGAKNLTMSGFPFPQGPTYRYVAQWVYPANSAEGTYQVYIDILDGDNVASSFRGPATFTLTRGLFPISLIPYFAAGGFGGVAALGGLVYYRRRRAKSYLVPFDYFNTLTGSEISPGTVVAIEGNTGSGKTILSQQLMFEDLKNGRPCVFVATGDFPSNIRAGMRNLGLDVTGYEQSGLLTFVDGYSSEAGQESKEKISIPSLSDLTTFGIKITSSLPTGSFKGGSLYFDSLTPLASKAKPESIVSLVQSVGARVKGMSGKAFFTVGPSVEPKVQQQLEELSDCVVQMEAFEERGVRKSRLKVAKYRARKYQQGWVLYTIEDGKGIIFYSKKPRK